MVAAKLKHLLAVPAFVLWGAFLLVVGEAEMGREANVVLALLTWTAAIAYIASCARTRPVVLSLVYIVTLGLFHLGLVVPVLFGLEPRVWPNWLDSDCVARALNICGVAFAFFASGVGLAMLRRHHSGVDCRQTHTFQDQSVAEKVLLLGGIVVAILGFVMLGLAIRRLNLFALSYLGYFAVQQQEGTRLFGVGFLLALPGVLIAAVGANKRQIGYIALSWALVLSPLFFFGFRFHLFLPLVCLLIIWHRKDRRRSLQAMCIAALLGILVLPTIKIMRATGAPFLEVVGSATILDGLMEMGGSLYPLVLTVENITGSTPRAYWYGRSYLMALRRLSLRWRPHRGFEGFSPTRWVTGQTRPWTSAKPTSLAYSGVAEPYLNFGRPGVIAFFLMLGFLLTWSESFSRQKPYFTAFLMCAFAGLLWTTRNDFVNFVRPAILAFLLVYAIKLIASMRLLHLRRSSSYSESSERNL